MRIAYLLVFFGLLVAGALIEASWWATALAGIVAMTPIAVADIVISSRRRAARIADA